MTNTEPSTLKKETRHVSVLGTEPIENNLKFQPKRLSIHVYICMILFIFFAGTMRDLGVFLIDIPPLNQLQTSTGMILFNWTPAFRSGEPLILGSKFKTIDFVCVIASSGREDCVEENKRKYLFGKKGKVWWYKAGVKGLFYSNMLLQLEVDGKIIIDYKSQKQKYLHHKNSYFYMDTAIFLVTLLFYLLFTLLNKFSNQNNHKNR